jgi:hypothetical protein
MACSFRSPREIISLKGQFHEKVYAIMTFDGGLQYVYNIRLMFYILTPQ